MFISRLPRASSTAHRRQSRHANESGPIQYTGVVQYDGRHILVNTEKQRAKYDNLHARRPVTVLAVEPPTFTPGSKYGRRRRGDGNGSRRPHRPVGEAVPRAGQYPFGQPGDIRVLFRIGPRRVSPRTLTCTKQEHRTAGLHFAVQNPEPEAARKPAVPPRGLKLAWHERFPLPDRRGNVAARGGTDMEHRAVCAGTWA